MHKRIVGLDIVRTVAIVLVLLCHLSYPFYPFLHGKAERVYNLAVWIFGYYGVEVFFVLSGFLIGSIFVREFASSDQSVPPDASLWRFWVRRWARTLPNYYLFLLINWLIARYMLGVHETPVIPYLLFIQKLTPDSTLHYFGVSWSLAVEEWFYLLMPVFFFLFYGIIRNPKIAFRLVIATMMLFPVLGKLLYALAHPQLANYENVYHFTTCFRLDSIAFGLLLSYLFYSENIKSYLVARKKLLLLAGLVITVVCCGLIALYLARPKQNALAFTAIMPLASLGVSCCLPYFATLNELSGAKSAGRMFVHCSKISYSLYLVHIPAMILIEELFKGAGDTSGFAASLGKYLLIISTTFVISSLIYRYFELPVMKFRDKKVKSN
ncbi:MAG: acyltransferase [Chitinophagaceae bacterium]